MSVIMVFTMFPALSSEAATNSWKSGDVTCKLSSSGTLTISGNGAMANCEVVDGKVVAAPWYSKRASIYKIVVGDGVTHIGNFAFMDATNLETIEFSDAGNLKSIGTQAFSNDFSIKGVSLPYGLISVGKYAFAYCSGAQTLLIPNTVKTLAYGCFYRMSSIVKVYIPASVTSIGDFAFGYNYKLAQVTGGAGVVAIGKQAFTFTYKLKVFKIASKKLKKIGSCCFYCSGLKTLYIQGTTKLTKKGVKNSLYLSSIKTVKVKKSKVKKYKKYFTKKNCKRKVKVKK